MKADECYPGRFVRHRLGRQKLMIVNTHLEVLHEGTVTWVRVRDEHLKMYDMSPEEIEADGVADGGNLS